MTKREKLVWAIDCDDVIVPMAHSLISAYNDRYGTSAGLNANFNHGYAAWEEVFLEREQILADRS